jgi:hypothetical protein
MSTSAVVPLSGADFGTSKATPSQQSVFQGLLGQLEQSIGGGDLTASQTLLNAIQALSPSSAGASDPLGSFLTSLDAALRDDSVSEAQSALAAYQQAAPTAAGNTTAAADPTATGAAETGTTDSNAVAKSAAAGLILSQVQLSLVNSLLSGDGAPTSSSTSSPTDPLGGLLDILNAVYAPDGNSAAGAGAASSASPYETLVSVLQSSLASGSGTAAPALEYLNSTGNFVNTSA